MNTLPTIAGAAAGVNPFYTIMALHRAPSNPVPLESTTYRHGNPEIQPKSAKWPVNSVNLGYRRPLDAAPTTELVRRLGEAFPADVVSALVDLWSGRERVPQESFGLQQLGGQDAAIANPDAA